ncbi:hypothetical protein V5799_016015 [Amblyomma americanum]|uniref:Uncharacterized protein n=2 Tax=Amblyomma americanum TaxID=6943 RepID=A0AAQ4F7N6_AMBAM
MSLTPSEKIHEASRFSSQLPSPLARILNLHRGLFQKIICLCGSLNSITTMAHQAASAILTRPVEHWCKPPVEHADLPPETGNNRSLLSEADAWIPSQCYRRQLTDDASRLEGCQRPYQRPRRRYVGARLPSGEGKRKQRQLPRCHGLHRRRLGLVVRSRRDRARPNHRLYVLRRPDPHREPFRALHLALRARRRRPNSRILPQPAPAGRPPVRPVRGRVQRAGQLGPAPLRGGSADTPRNRCYTQSL